MSYEKELSQLQEEWKKSTDKYEEAIEDGYDVDADMWSHDVMEIERKIYVYEQATKADEYEAKAKAFDQTKETLKEDVRKLEKLEKDFPLSCQNELKTLNNVLVLMARYESGELGE